MSNRHVLRSWPEMAAVRLSGLRSAQPTIRLHVLPILGDRWFMPRFSRFADLHPGVDVQFTTFAPSDTLDQADAVFRFGDGIWPGWDASDVWKGWRSHRVSATDGAGRRANRCQPGPELSGFGPFAHLSDGDVSGAAHNLPDFRPSRVVRLGYYALVIRAAISGQGLALVPRVSS